MSFDKSHAFVAKWEGGLTDHPADPGGITNYGVSLRFLLDQGLDVGDIDHDGDIDADDIRALSKDDAKRIFRSVFWTSQYELLDKTHPCCAMVCYDTSVNMGLSYGRRLLQQALGGLAVDGIWGPLTWSAIANSNDRITAQVMIELRRARYRYLVDRNRALKVFLNGWLNRCDDLERAIR